MKYFKNSDICFFFTLNVLDVVKCYENNTGGV